jgi:hypothetical protein
MKNDTPALPPLPNNLVESTRCPISQAVFLNPVTLLPCMHSIEKDEIDKWFVAQTAQGKPNTCPCCQKAVTEYKNNFELKSLIDALSKVYDISAHSYQPAGDAVISQHNANNNNANASSSSSSSSHTAAGTFAQLPPQGTQHLVLQQAPVAVDTETRQIKLPHAAILLSPYFSETYNTDQIVKICCIGKNSGVFWCFWNPGPATLGCDMFIDSPSTLGEQQARISRYHIWEHSILSVTDAMLKFACRSNIILFFSDEHQRYSLTDVATRITTHNYSHFNPRVVNISYQAEGDTFAPLLTDDQTPIPPTMRTNRAAVQHIAKQLTAQLAERLTAWSNELRDAEPGILNQEQGLLGPLRFAPAAPPRPPSPSCSVM